MDVENLFGSMIEGALLGRGKRSHGARRFLRGGGGFLNASTLLTVGGLVWGAIETMQQQSAQTRPAPVPPMGGTAAGGGGPQTAPPPLPGAGQATAAPADAAAPRFDEIPEGAQRLVRLMVSAARADGTLSDAERATMIEHARAVGAEALVEDEIARPTPLARIVDGVTEAQQRRDLYVLAYSIVRADEAVSGSEQIYLAQLGALLGLGPNTRDELERNAAARIAEAGDAGSI